jgi:ATP-dependent Clp protease ATP-binding subunit ClpA
MIAQELEVSLHMAFVDARASRHEFITVEHLLAALLDNATAVEVLLYHHHHKLHWGVIII